MDSKGPHHFLPCLSPRFPNTQTLHHSFQGFWPLSTAPAICAHVLLAPIDLRDDFMVCAPGPPSGSDSLLTGVTVLTGTYQSDGWCPNCHSYASRSVGGADVQVTFAEYGG